MGWTALLTFSTANRTPSLIKLSRSHRSRAVSRYCPSRSPLSRIGTDQAYNLGNSCGALDRIRATKATARKADDPTPCPCPHGIGGAVADLGIMADVPEWEE